MDASSSSVIIPITVVHARFGHTFLLYLFAFYTCVIFNMCHKPADCKGAQCMHNDNLLTYVHKEHKQSQSTSQNLLKVTIARPFSFTREERRSSFCRNLYVMICDTFVLLFRLQIFQKDFFGTFCC